MPSQILILSFHRIGFPPSQATHKSLFTTPRLLAFHVRFLRFLGYRFATLKDAMASNGGKIAVITFDDGYLDNFTLGLPVLEKFNIPATVFAITGDIGAKNLSWGEAGEKLPADLMGWDMLRSLADRGWEIGSHAHTHIHLASHSGARQEYEILRSIREIEDNIGQSPVSFAYPYGSYDQRTKGVLEKTGIKNAVTIKRAEKSFPIKTQDPLQLSRVSIGGRNPDHYCKSVYRIVRAMGLMGLVPFNRGSAAYPVSPETTLVAANQALAGR